MTAIWLRVLEAILSLLSECQRSYQTEQAARRESALRTAVTRTRERLLAGESIDRATALVVAGLALQALRQFHSGKLAIRTPESLAAAVRLSTNLKQGNAELDAEVQELPSGDVLKIIAFPSGPEDIGLYAPASGAGRVYTGKVFLKDLPGKVTFFDKQGVVSLSEAAGELSFTKVERLGKTIMTTGEVHFVDAPAGMPFSGPGGAFVGPIMDAPGILSFEDDTGKVSFKGIEGKITVHASEQHGAMRAHGEVSFRSASDEVASIAKLMEKASVVIQSQDWEMASSRPRAWRAFPHKLKNISYIDSPGEAPSPRSEPDEPRRVDLRLERQTFEGGARKWQPKLRASTFECSGLYRITLSIGRNYSDSAVASAAPPIEPSLSPRTLDGWELRIVLYPCEFKLLSGARRVLTLRLPLRGPSSEVQFQVQAPAVAGSAHLRVAIYSENHLAQSFVLRATVTDGPEQHSTDETGLFALEHSRTRGFTRLSRLKPRLASIAVNASTGRSTHQVCVVASKLSADVSVSELAMAQTLKEFRALMKEAAVDSSNAVDAARFSRFDATDEQPCSQSEFHSFAWRLALQGKQLFHGVFLESEATRKIANQLRVASDGVIQVVRMDHHFAFPWHVVYDFPVPDKALQGPVPVCSGFNNDAPCGHSDSSGVLCMRGFWGFRHRLEHLVSREDDSKNTACVVQWGRDPRVLVSVYQEIAAAHARIERLVGELPAQVRTLKSGESLLDELWKTSDSAALAAVIGHLETGVIAGEPIAPRIILSPGQSWLTHHGLAERLLSSREMTPGKIVLLMACGSADDHPAELNSIFSTMMIAGAAAVVGAECPIFGSFASHAATHLTKSFVGGKSLGHAIQSLRQDLCRCNNPLGFALTALGDADLTMCNSPGVTP